MLQTFTFLAQTLSINELVLNRFTIVEQNKKTYGLISH